MSDRRPWRLRRRREEEHFDRSDASERATEERRGAEDASEVSLEELLGDLPGPEDRRAGQRERARGRAEGRPDEEERRARGPRREDDRSGLDRDSLASEGRDDPMPRAGARPIPAPDAAAVSAAERREPPSEPPRLGLAPEEDREDEPELSADALAELDAERAEPPVETAEPTARAGGRDPWSTVESLFDRAETPGGEGGEEEGGEGLQLEWERPRVFEEPAQEEVLRRLGDLAEAVEALQRRLDRVSDAVARVREPDARTAAVLKRLELIERGFEELRLQQERAAVRATATVAGVGDTVGELRAALEEPLLEISERVAGAEARLAHLEASERLAEQVNLALGRNPFDIVSTEEIDELTAGVTERVRRLAGRVDRLEGALDRGLAGIEEARRAAVEAAGELARLAERAESALRRAERVQRDGEPAPPREEKLTARKPSARKPAAKKATAKKATAKRSAGRKTQGRAASEESREDEAAARRARKRSPRR